METAPDSYIIIKNLSSRLLPFGCEDAFSGAAPGICRTRGGLLFSFGEKFQQCGQSWLLLFPLLSLFG